MNYKRVGYLSKLFFLFFLRNILQVGILKKRSFRIILTGMFVLLATYLTVIMSFFFVDNSVLSRDHTSQTRISCQWFFYSFLPPPPISICCNVGKRVNRLDKPCGKQGMSLSSSFVNELRLLGFLIGPLVKRSPLFNTPYRGGGCYQAKLQKKVKC